MEQYRKPEFRIDITPARPYFINGDTAEFRVDAKYFFGAPLKGALVKYRFYESRLRDTDTTYWWEEDYGPGDAYNRIKLEGERYLDDNGWPPCAWPAGASVRTRDTSGTIVDRSNVSISYRARVRVGRGDFTSRSNRSSLLRRRRKEDRRVKTIAHDGTPVSAPVVIRCSLHRKPLAARLRSRQGPRIRSGNSGPTRRLIPARASEKFDCSRVDIPPRRANRRENLITASRVCGVRFARRARDSRFKNLEIS